MLDWEITKFDETGMDIKVNFSEPQKVSSGSEPDIMVI